MNRKIDAVMIDTSAYHKNQCDFAGITNSIIPMLLQLLEANDILLLTHPVLEGEIKKHIRESELVTRIEHLQTSLKKYNRQLQICFKLFSDILLCRHLLHKLRKHIFRLLVGVRQVAIQFSAE